MENEKWQGIEKRKFPRAKFPCEVIVFLPEEKRVTTETENIGCGGASVLLREQCKISSLVGLEIFIDRENPVKCKAKVVWCIQKNDTEFDLGFEFTEITDNDKGRIEIIVDSLLESD